VRERGSESVCPHLPPHSSQAVSQPTEVFVLVYRGAQSFELTLQVPPSSPSSSAAAAAAAVGWEKNSSGKVLEQSVDLSSVLDARALATAAAQLNVRRVWRVTCDV
jgi:hypothetical protein